MGLHSFFKGALMAVTGFRRTPNLLDVPHFIKARTAKDLQQLMLKNNTRLKSYVQYFNIQYVESERAWFAWYFLDFTDERKG